MNLMIAAILAAAALMWMRPQPWRRLRRLDPHRPPTSRRRGVPWLVTALVQAGVTMGGLIWRGTAGAAVGFSVGLSGITVFWLWRSHRGAVASRRNAETIVEACQLLAGLLRVGHVPATALRLAAADSPIFAEAAAAQQVGGSVVGVLRRQAGGPGCSGLAELATAWEVAERTGASLTATLDGLADRLEADRAVARTVDAELSAPRATGRTLAALPVAGLLLGYGIGGDPGAFLLGSALGQACLVAATVLACAGVWWIERIASSGGG